MKGAFIFDLVGSFPLNLVLMGITSSGDHEATSPVNGALRTNRLLRIIRLTKLTKLFRMVKLGTYLEYVQVCMCVTTSGRVLVICRARHWPRPTQGCSRAHLSNVALSLCRIVALSHCRSVALSLCRIVALSHCRIIALY